LLLLHPAATAQSITIPGPELEWSSELDTSDVNATSTRVAGPIDVAAHSIVLLTAHPLRTPCDDGPD
jgi:hypothetical protein